MQTCTSDRKLGPARGNKKQPKRFCPLSARCGAWPLKKLRSEYEAGVSPQTAKPRHDRVPRECACQGESKNSSVQKEQRNTRMTHPTFWDCHIKCSIGGL